MEKFVIISIPRSGSTVLTRTLDNHPEIFCAGELFNTSKDIHHPEFHFASWGSNSKKHSVQFINRIINYVNHRLRSVPHIKSFYCNKVKNKKAMGFKLMLSNIKTAPYLWRYIKKENIKVIVLIRSNVFKIALSRYRKAKSRVAHITEGQIPSKLFHVPADKLINQMKEIENANYNLIKFSEGMNRMIVVYSDFYNWEETINKIEDFLCVKNIALVPALKKIAAANWQNEVENYKEIEQLLQQNNFSKYLNSE